MFDAVTRPQLDGTAAADVARGAAGASSDWSAEVHEFHHHTSDHLLDVRAEAVREQRKWRMRELAAVRVLDSRGLVDDSWAAADGVTIADVRTTVATARALEGLPEVAAVASEGALSEVQLTSVTQIADPDTDAEWADRAQHCTPAEIKREVRKLRTPTVEESRKRQAARAFWASFDERAGHWKGGFCLPEIEGAQVMAVLNARAEQMTPKKGEAWEPLRQRLADAFREAVLSDGPERPPAKSHVLVNVPVDGPAEINGVPIANERLEQLLANASLEINLVDDHGVVVGMAPTTTLITSRVMKSVRLHDVHCRWPGCTSTIGLEIHHIVPRSWGGTDDVNNLVCVCAPHHRQLVPHGPWALAGAPRQVGGLELITADEMLADLDRPVRARGPSG